MEGFSRDLLCGIGKGDAPPPEQRPGQLPEEMEEVELSLGLSLGGRFGVDRKGDNLPRSSSVAAMLTPLVEVPVPLEPRRTSSLPVQAEAPEVPASGIPFSAYSEAVIEEHSSSSSVPFSGEAMSSVMAASPPPPSSLAPRTATLGSRGDEGSSGRPAARANNTGDVERRLMQEMPSVFTKGLPNGKRVEGFLYRYRKADDVKIVCICHGSFLTPSEFVEHAGGGKVDNPSRHIVVSLNPTL